MKQLVIVGGGFAGVRLARKLKHRKDIQVLLVNATPDFRYCPALYRAATGYKSGVARIPLEWMLLDVPNTELLIDSAVSADLTQRTITLESGRVLEYDMVAFALGSITTYFGIEGLHEHAFGIKSPEEIDALRSHIHEKIMSGEREERNYVVVGAGPTGVEMAAALGGYLKKVARKHRHGGHKISIWLVEAAPRVVPQLNAFASKLMLSQLKRHGVKVLTNTQVRAETLHTLKTSSGTINTHTVIWTAGTAVNPFYAQNSSHFAFAERGRVAVGKHLDVGPHAYVLGDNAATKYSGLAYTAIKDADYVAKDICRRLDHKTRFARKDHRPVQVVPAGHGWAIMQYGPIVFAGRAVSLLRRAADIVGYTDVLGFLKSLTIWTNSERVEDGCPICHGKRSAHARS